MLSNQILLQAQAPLYNQDLRKDRFRQEQQELKQRQPSAIEWLDETASGRRIGIGLISAAA